MLRPASLKLMGLAMGLATGLVASGCGSGTDPSDPAALTDASTPAGSPSDTDKGAGDSGASTADGPSDNTDSTATDSAADSPTDRAWAPTDLAPGVGAGNTAAGKAAAWMVEILDIRPHDTPAFTQGFEIHEGTLYESTGLTGKSTVRTVDIGSGEVISSVDVDADVFAEGLTITGEQIIQITYRSELAYVRDLDSLAVVAEFEYEGQGWGICYDGSRLVMSDGTAELEFRDPSTFDIVGTVQVRLDGEPLALLNELECVDGYVLANVWKTNMIVVIDPNGGEVVATIDASVLAVDATGIPDDDVMVLNGIARLDGATFLLTGKEWPTMYRVRFVAA